MIVVLILYHYRGSLQAAWNNQCHSDTEMTRRGVSNVIKSSEVRAYAAGCQYDA